MDAIVKQAISADKPKPLRAILWGGLRVRRSGYYGRARRLRLPRTSTDSAAARDRRRIAGSAGPPRRASRPLCSVFFCHFFIAFCAAAVYFTASRWVYFLLRHAVLSGILYGVTVYFFMNRIVVPLSAARKYPFSFRMMVIGVVIHIFCVGLPIAITVRRYS